MLFPDHELVKTFTRDCWLINNYCPPNEMSPPKIILENQPASMLPGGITYISGMVSQGRTGFAPIRRDDPGKVCPPKKLISKVDRAYFRQSLRKEVSLWFPRHGFDLKRGTISKEDFEAALAKRSAAPRPARKLTDEELLQLQPEFVKNHLAPYSAESRPRPTQKELREKWRTAGHGTRCRDELDEELRKQAKRKGILLKPGRQKKHAR
jgi:hypothetical protein